MSENRFLTNLPDKSPLLSVENEILRRYERTFPQLENPFLNSNSTRNRLLTSLPPSTTSTLALDSVQITSNRNLEFLGNDSPNLSNAQFDAIKESVVESGSICSQNDYSDQDDISLEEFEGLLVKDSEMEIRDSYPQLKKTKEHEAFIETPISVEQEDETRNLKFELLQVCTTSLLSKPKLRNPEDSIRQKIIQLCTKVLVKDPVFILKLALYCRRELNLRDVALLLLSFSSLHSNTFRNYFLAYFSNCIMTPGEWVSVADFLVTFERKNKCSIPSMLRKAMVKKFTHFDEYQLAKYQFKGRSNKKRKATTTERDDDKMELDEDIHPLESRSFNIKRLIRLLHIHEPPNYVMRLLGKKYPETKQRFMELKLDGEFTPENADKRMRLATPETWEAQISLHGNKSEVWHNLITSKRIPYLALIRNLRNIVLSGINENQLLDVIDSIKCLTLINSSKVFPHQYLYAYFALEDVRMSRTKHLREMKRRKRKKITIDPNQKKQETEFPERLQVALEEAVQVSLSRNLASIEGHTLIFIANPKYDAKYMKGYGLSVEFPYMNVLSFYVGSILRQASKSSKLLLCTGEGVWQMGKRKVKMGSLSSIFSNIVKNDDGSLSMIENYLFNIAGKVKIDNLIVILENPPHEKDKIDHFVEFIDYYRNLSVISNNMVMALMTVQGSLPTKPPSKNNLNVFVSGFGESALKSISQLRSGANQLEEVESIDQRYKILEKCPLSFPCLSPLPKIKWTKIKIFVSSTFLDMFGERNLLNYCVFPELRRRCRKICVEITPLDLRWGLPEDQMQELSTTKYCLERVEESDIFICFLGERYGWKPKHSGALESRFFEGNESVIQRFKKGNISITELEIRLRKWRRAQFYIRDPSTLSLLESANADHYLYKSQTIEDAEALRILKEDIRQSGCPVYENYRAASLNKSSSYTAFANFEENFIRTLIDRLWQDILDIRSEDTAKTNDSMIAFISKESQEFIGREKELETIKETLLSDPNEFKCVEVEGTGKTAFLCQLASSLWEVPDVIVIPFFSDGVMDSFCIMKYLEDQILQLCSKTRCLNESESYLSFARVARLISQIKTLGKIVVLIVDEPPQDNSSWIPYCDFPPGVRIVVSSSTPDTVMSRHLSLRRRKYDLDRLLTLKCIKDMKVKKELVKTFLKRMGDKVLSEAPLNNVLRLVASKKESGNLNYLKSVCSVLVSSDAIINGNEKTMIKDLIPGDIDGLYNFILDRNDEDSYILLPVLYIVYECEGPSFDQLLKATESLIGRVVPPMLLLRALNRIEVFMEPSLKQGIFLRNNFRSTFLKNYLKNIDYKPALWKHFTKEFTSDAADSNCIHPYILKSILDLSILLDNNSFIRNLNFIYHWAKHGAESMEYFYYQCAQFKNPDRDLMNFLHFNSQSLLNNPMLIYQHGINSTLTKGLNEAGLTEISQNETKDDAFVLLEILNKKDVLLLSNFEIKTSFSKLIISCASTLDGMWVFGSKDSVIVQLQDSSMFSLHVHSAVMSICFAGSDVVMVGLEDGSVSFWDIHKRIQIAHHPQIHFKSVTSTFLTPLSKNIVSTGLDGNVFTYSASFKGYHVVGQYSHSFPISTGIALNESVIVIGDWEGELLKVNIINGKVIEDQKLSCKSAISDISALHTDNAPIVIASSDTEGYIYIADEHLTLNRCRKISQDKDIPTQIGNKINLVSENEMLVACSDGCVRRIEFGSFHSNFYENRDDVIKHRFPISLDNKLPDFNKDLVVCMDAYKTRKIIGYDSSWVRILCDDGSSYSIKMLEKKGELSQVVLMENNIAILVTNTSKLISFRFDDQTKEVYDVRKTFPSDVGYQDYILPISREKASFIYPHKDCKISIYQITDEPLNKVKKRSKVDIEIKGLAPECISDDLISCGILKTIYYKNNIIVALENNLLSIWRYSEEGHKLEKLHQRSHCIDYDNVCLQPPNPCSKTWLLFGTHPRYLDRVPTVSRFNLSDLKDHEFSEDVNEIYLMNGHDTTEIYFYKKGLTYKYLSGGEFYDLINDPASRIHYRRNGKIIMDFGDDEEEGIIILKNELDHLDVRVHDVNHENDLLSLSMSSPNYIDNHFNVCTSNSRLRILNREDSVEEKRNISSVLPVLGGDDRDWILVSLPFVYLYSLSSFGPPEAKETFQIRNEIDFVIHSVWRSSDNGSLTFSCFSKAELFSVIIHSNGKQERRSLWYNKKPLFLRFPSKDDYEYDGSNISEDEDAMIHDNNDDKDVNMNDDDECDKSSVCSSISRKSSRSSSSFSSSSSSTSSSASISSSSNADPLEEHFKYARNGLIGIDWNMGYKFEIVTLGFEDGSIHTVHVNNSKELKNLPLHRSIESINHFFHPKKNTLKVNCREASCYVSLREGLNIFGSFDGYILIEDASGVHKCLGHKEAITSIIKIDEHTFASVSTDKYCKIWKLINSKRIQQVGEFLSRVPLYNGGFSTYTGCFILGGAFGVVYFLKMRNCIRS